jgi:hypothetical protein
MARRNGQSAGNPLFIIQLVLGLFLATLGLAGLVEYNSTASELGRALNQAFGGSNDVVPVIVAILELAAGVFILAALFVPVKPNILFILVLAILVLWLIRVLSVYVLTDAIFEPTFLVWLNRVSADLLPAAALWLVAKRYS